MTDKSSRVYVILGNAQWNFADCQTALSLVPARMTRSSSRPRRSRAA